MYMYEQTPNQPENPFQASHMTAMRTTFFGKVMTFFALAILASLVGTYTTYTYFMETFLASPWIMYALFALELGLVFSARTWSQKVPLNRFLFAAFAFISGATLAPLIAIVIATPGGILLLNKALLATGAMFTATALLGWTVKRDLSGLRGFLLMGLIGMIAISIIGIFIPWNNNFELVFSGGGVVLFSAFTMYDFQKIKKYPEDRYIDAALALYLDIFNLFIFILRFIIALSGRD